MNPPSSLPPALDHLPEPMTPPTLPSLPARSASTCTAPSIHDGRTLMCSCVLQQVGSLSSVTFSDQSGPAHLCSSCLSTSELSPPGGGTTRVCVQIPFSVLTKYSVLRRRLTVVLTDPSELELWPRGSDIITVHQPVQR